MRRTVPCPCRPTGLQILSPETSTDRLFTWQIKIKRCHSISFRQDIEVCSFNLSCSSFSFLTNLTCQNCASCKLGTSKDFLEYTRNNGKKSETGYSFSWYFYSVFLANCKQICNRERWTNTKFKSNSIPWTVFRELFDHKNVIFSSMEQSHEWHGNVARQILFFHAGCRTGALYCSAALTRGYTILWAM